MTATMVACPPCPAGRDERPEVHEWLADPGIEIPEEASDIHGVTTAIARAEGRPERDVLAELLEWLAGHWSPSMPIAFYNAPYDLTLIERRAQAHGLLSDDGLPIRGPILDGLVMDRMHPSTRFRATAHEGGRTLVNVSKFYGVPLAEDAAHNATADCLAAVRVARAAGRRHRSLGKMSARDMYIWQVRSARAWAAEMQVFLRKKAVEENKSAEEIAAIVLNGSWPIIKGDPAEQREAS